MGRDTKLFVRGVSERISVRELREVFEKYGRVLDVKTGQAGFAFVEMDEERDCYECIKYLDDTVLDGQRIIVEKAREKSHHEDRGDRDRGDRGDRGDRRDRDRGGEFRCYNCNRPGHLARDCTEPPRNPLYADTRGTRVNESGDGRGGREDRFRYGRDRDYDRFGRDYRGEYRDDRDRDRERRSYDPRIERDYGRDREREYDRRSPSSRYPSYRGGDRDGRDNRDNRDTYRRSFSPVRGRSPERGGYSYRAPESRRSRSRTPPERSYRGGSRSPPRDRARTPPDRPRENGDKDDLSKPPSSPGEGRRTPPDTL